jgi:hypothetical protein
MSFIGDDGEALVLRCGELADSGQCEGKGLDGADDDLLPLVEGLCKLAALGAAVSILGARPS